MTSSPSLLCKACVLLAIAVSIPAFASRLHRGPTGRTSHTAKIKKAAKLHGQREIDSERTREIQAALIREHYMFGEPTGQWDATTNAAMQKFQSDQGWQSKLAPDSRALIKLGLGPGAPASAPAANLTPPPSSAPAASNSFSASSGLPSQN